MGEALRVVSKERQECEVVWEQYKPIAKRLYGEMAVLEKELAKKLFARML